MITNTKCCRAFLLVRHIYSTYFEIVCTPCTTLFNCKHNKRNLYFSTQLSYFVCWFVKFLTFSAWVLLCNVSIIQSEEGLTINTMHNL